LGGLGHVMLDYVKGQIDSMEFFAFKLNLILFWFDMT